LLQAELEANIGKNKVLLVMGTRRVGKTFLLKTIEKKLDRQIIKLNGEDLDA
jgi:predicted AAA+ superfamily ATPase